MSHLRRFLCVVAGSLALALAVGCGGSGSGSGGGGGSTPVTQPISLAISPLNPLAMTAGAVQTFTATVVNDAANAGVTWSASAGSITASGVYTAPTPVATASATVTATSKTDTTKSYSVTVPLTPATVTPISVNPIFPSTASLGLGGSQSFAASVANDSTNSGVSWSIGSGPGTLTASTTSGVTYNAPATPVATLTSVTLTATSKADPTKSTTATITLNPVTLAVVPSNAVMGGGATQAFAATVAYDATNAGVTWSVTGGGSFSATSTLSGVATNYTAASPLTGSTAVVTATSKADPTRSQSVTVTLDAISLNPISPATVTLGTSSSQAFTDSVNYDGTNSGVSWSLVGPGSLSASSTSGVTYNSPTTVIGSTTTATLMATSIKDPTKSTTATITLAPIAVSLTSPGTLTLDGNGQQAVTVSAAITGDGTGSGATFVVTGTGGTISSSPMAGNSPSATYTVPTITTAGSTTITVASVADPTRKQTVSITLNPPMTFTTPQGTLASGATAVVYPSTSIVVAGGTGAKTFSITSGVLPAGLTMSAAGVITGTPTGTAGTSTFTVSVVDQASTPATITGTFAISIGATTLSWVTPTVGTQTFTVGNAITPIALSAAGGVGNVTYTLNSGTLPQGLQLVGNQITGTPTAPTVVAGNAIRLLATDSATPKAATAVSATLTLVANPVPLAITTIQLPQGTVGTPYSYLLTSIGGTGAVTWTLASGSLANTGLTLSATGLLFGTPTVYENGLNLTFQAQDSATNQQQTKTVSLPLNVFSPLSITTGGALPTAPVNSAYSQTLAATGGSGTGYTWTVTSGVAGTSSLASLNLSMSAAGVITGTPTVGGTAVFTVQVKDSANNTASAFFAISTSPALALPSPNPSPLGQAVINISYGGAIIATGGFSGYTWLVNGNPVPTNGATLSLNDGLTVSNLGGTAVLTLGGTPTGTGSVPFTASVQDSKGTLAGPLTYTVNVSNVYTVGGQINSQVGCTTGGLAGVTVSINTNPVQTTTTSANGSFSFSNVPNGTYTITPSITGSSVAFYPATETVTVNSNNVATASITATLGYSVSGTVAYSGTQSGQIYLVLNPTGSCGGRSPGTSVSATGAYTIRGVPPGGYTMQSFLDTVGDGVPNAANPTGTTAGVNVLTSNITGVAVTLTDPAPVTLTTAPTLKTVAAFNTGVLAQYVPITNSSGVETANYYTFQWSNSPTFQTIAGSRRFPASGTHSNIWLLHGLTNGSILYFRAYGTSAGTLQGPYSPTIGPVTISAPTVGNVVSGTVSFTTPATGPMYVGFYD
ncbi:MAG: putative Ig domain-containing protein, partial [Mycobacterium sp.]|nr:putative Ig domain-containing protein [Mycobacterium sp.]